MNVFLAAAGANEGDSGQLVEQLKVNDPSCSFHPLALAGATFEILPHKRLNGLQEPRWHCRPKTAQLVGACSVAVELIARSDSGSESVRADSGREWTAQATRTRTEGGRAPGRDAADNAHERER